MKLEILKKALEHYIPSADCSEADRQHVFDAIAECNQQIERFNSRELWKDTVYLVTSDTLSDLLNMTTYDTYGKLARTHNGDVPFGYYEHAVRNDFDFELTNEALRLGYDVISDLWRDNDTNGDNNPDGTFKFSC